MTMTACPSCNRTTFAYGEACDRCGKPLGDEPRMLIGAGGGLPEDFVCRHCSYVNQPEARTCEDCGNPLEGGFFPSCEEPEVFGRSLMRTVYSDEDGETEGESCIVTLADDHITVSYDNEDEDTGAPINYKYRGKDHGGGHYELRFRQTNPDGAVVEGHATLHRLTPDSKILEGFWKETTDGEACRGAWQIILRK